jgi:hypothetical protein
MEVQGVATIKAVQQQIRRIEGFDVHFTYEGPGPHPGKDVRDDRTGIRSYPYERAAADKVTVGAWIETRFRATFPGFAVIVLDAHGDHVNTRTKLASVRAGYRE